MNNSERPNISSLLTIPKKNKWRESYFWDKIFPILVTVLLTAVASFTVAYFLKVVEIRKLRAEVQTLENRELMIQSGIKKAITSGDSSALLDMFDKINRFSSASESDKRQFRMLVDKLDDLEEKFALALAKNDDTSASIIMHELKKTRKKIQRLADWGNIP